MPNLIVYDAPNLKEHRCCINIILKHRLSDCCMEAQHTQIQVLLKQELSLRSFWMSLQCRCRYRQTVSCINIAVDMKSYGSRY